MNTRKILDEIHAQVADEHALQAMLRRNRGEMLLSMCTWSDLSNEQRGICIHHLVSESQCPASLEVRIRLDLGLPNADIEIDWDERSGTSNAEWSALGEYLGAMVSASGAVVVVTIDGQQYF